MSFLVSGGFIIYCPMTEQHVSSLTLLVLHTVSSHLVPHQQEVSDSDAARQGTLIISHFMTIEQYVSDTALLLPPAEQSHDQLSHPRTISRWVALHYFLLPDRCHDQQLVSDTAFFFNMSHPMFFISLWVTLHFLLCQESAHVLCHDQQTVSDFHTYICQADSCLMHGPWPTVCEWYFIFILPAVSHHVPWVLWPPVGEWHCILILQALSLIVYHPMINRGQVTLHFFLLPSSLIVSHPMTNRRWAFIFGSQSDSNDIILWPPGCEWHCIFYFAK